LYFFSKSIFVSLLFLSKFETQVDGWWLITNILSFKTEYINEILFLIISELVITATAFMVVFFKISSFLTNSDDFVHSGSSIFSLCETSGTVIIKSVSSRYSEYCDGPVK
jgi:hypothetical protein